MRHSNKECDNVAESRPGSNTDSYLYILYLFTNENEMKIDNVFIIQNIYFLV